MPLDPGHYLTLAAAGVATIVWLIRLEAKIETNRAEITAHREAHKVFIAKVEEDAKFYRDSREKFTASHAELRETMVRVETQLANLTHLVEHLPHYRVPANRKPPAA